MLTVLEEIVLLAVDERSGRLRSTHEFGAAYALVGAVFFDLTLAKRTDTGLEDLQVIDSTPTGNPTLDRFLAELCQHPELKTVSACIEFMFHQRRDLEREALESLIARGILRHEKSKRLWVIDVERFPSVDNRPQRDVKLRLAEAILSDGIPDTRDIMLVSLAEPCGLLSYVLSDSELENRRERIRMLCKLETISRKVSAAIVELDKNIRIAMQKLV
jgi:golgi phosphoprotein 3